MEQPDWNIWTPAESQYSRTRVGVPVAKKKIRGDGFTKLSEHVTDAWSNDTGNHLVTAPDLSFWSYFGADVKKGDTSFHHYYKLRTGDICRITGKGLAIVDHIVGIRPKGSSSNYHCYLVVRLLTRITAEEFDKAPYQVYNHDPNTQQIAVSIGKVAPDQIHIVRKSGTASWYNYKVISFS